MRIKLSHKFEDLVSVDNLLNAWEEFIVGKRKKIDVLEFQEKLMDNIFSLNNDLLIGKYTHGGYEVFNICDPKPRIIHKATVRDRLLHRAVYRQLYPFFDKVFISDSFSCRNGKGTHKAINRFNYFARKLGENNTKPVWILKCDIKKFFASIDQDTLLSILNEYILDDKVKALLKEIILSFYSTDKGKGIPLGNLTSQLFANIYLNELDKFIKNKLRIRYYARYADDFVILDKDKAFLEFIIPSIDKFLKERLKLAMHPDKVFIKSIYSGVDFLGWINFPGHKVLRKKTKERMFIRIKESPNTQTISSYLGMLTHGEGYKLQEKILRTILA